MKIFRSFKDCMVNLAVVVPAGLTVLEGMLLVITQQHVWELWVTNPRETIFSSALLMIPLILLSVLTTDAAQRLSDYGSKTVP